MKTLKGLLIVLFLIASVPLTAQEQYQINGESLTLKTEVDGTLTLLWNTFNKQYRYFVKKGNSISELTNTKQDGDYQEEYKETIKMLTADAAMDTAKLRLTLASLRSFINKYNAAVDPNYQDNSETVKFETRLGVFAGVTNNIFTANPENTLSPLAGLDFEILDSKLLKRHSIVVQFRQTFKSDEFMYSSSQLSLNYRFKFVYAPTFALFVNTKLATYTYSKTTFDQTQNPNGPSEVSGGNLQAPIIFGLGADIKLGTGFLIVGYNDLIGLTIDDNGEFPIDFSLGYKFNL